MNLIMQATQPPPEQEYRKCERCGIALAPPARKPKYERRFCSKGCANTRIPKNPDPTPQECADGVRRIELTQGQYAIVDASDYEWLNQWVWYAVWKKKNKCFVPVRNTETRGTQYMPRVIMGEPAGVIVDHENHNSLDNTRKNLRRANFSQNARNARKHCISSSRFKGVYWRKPWNASITVSRKRIFLGSFDTEEEAAEAYRVAALKYHGEFACIPDPQPSVVIS